METFDLKTYFQNALLERYQKEVTDGFVGTYEEWTERNKKDYEQIEKQKEDERSYKENPKYKIENAHDYQNPYLPLNWNVKTFENMEVEKGTKLDKIIQVLKTQTLNDCGFWLSGGVGCGKTHILLSMLNLISYQFFNEYGEIGSQIKYYNYSDLCSVLRDDPNNFDKFHRIRSPYFMFIDDIGVSKSSDFMQEKIYSLFNYRVEQNLTTFVTTNLTLKEIQEEFNDRMVSRIKESSAWIDMSGIKDYRSNFIKDNMKRFKGIIE